MGEHFVDIEGVTGSIPVTPTIHFTRNSPENRKIVSAWRDRADLAKRANPDLVPDRAKRDKELGRSIKRVRDRNDVDLRSCEERGIDREPTRHRGAMADDMERKGRRSRIGIAAMLILDLAVFSFSPAAPALSEPQSVVFHLRVDPENPETGFFFADTSAFSSLTLLPPRSNPVSGTPGSAAIRCINRNSTGFAAYGVPTHCARIEWRVRFNKADDLTSHVAEQNNLYSETGWWALFEWDRIPRMKGDTDIDICARISAEAPLCRRLPPVNRPPLLFIFGKSALDYRALGRRFRIFTDRTGTALVDMSARQRLSGQYRYLSGLFPASGRPAEAVHIAWVGIDRNRRALGGAAGENAYIANYAVTRTDRTGRERLFWISGHEAFHMLAPHDYPLWIEESLAHYYGYKSLRRSGPTRLRPEREWQKQQLPGVARETGLVVAHSRVLNGDMRYYGLFYGKGAAFWQALDIQLGNSGASLDRYLHLLAYSGQQDGALAPAFITAVTGAIGKRAFAELAAQYLQ